MSLLQCYHKGCLAKYDPEENTAESCKYHPGEPIFHDALKKWSCCKKYSTDFTEFLNIAGCTVGMHSNIRPTEPKVEPPLNTPIEVAKKVTPTVLEPVSPEPTPRPTDAGPLVPLAIQILPSLTNALAKLPAALDEERSAGDVDSETNGDLPTDDVKVGTKCVNNGCFSFFTHDLGKNNEVCRYHPGIAIFHEGMKYWSCCHNHTSDFEVFTKEPGCTYGHHVWKEPVSTEPSKANSCRYEWFQSSGDVTLIIYAKLVRPHSLSVMANRMSVTASFQFGQPEPKTCTQTIHFFGVIDPSNSYVKASPTKLELSLKKAESKFWSRLEVDPPKPIITYQNITEVENREDHICWRDDCG